MTQAGMLCKDARFRAFLREQFGLEAAAAGVRLLCGVQSRREITRDNRTWKTLLATYHHWRTQ